MGTHTVHADCVKCRGKDSLIYTFDTRNPISGEALTAAAITARLRRS